MKKTFSFLFTLSLYLLSLQAQQPLETIKRMYISPDSKLFINKDLGLYLWMSNSPDPKSEKVRLFSDSTKKYTNPMYLDMNGFNSIRTPWAVDTSTKKAIMPLRDIVFEVYADGIPPVSKAEYISKTSRVLEGKKFYGRELSIKIISRDEISGVFSTYYSLNGQPFSECKEELKSFPEGENILKHYATDNVGNRENVKEEIFYTDNTPPKTDHEIIGTLNTKFVSPDATIKLKSSDNLSGVKAIYYKINNGKPILYTTPISVMVLSDTSGTITYYAEDNLGNKEEPKSLGGKENNMQVMGSAKEMVFEFYVDNQAPEVKLEMEGDSYKGKFNFVSPRTKFKINATDDKSGVDKVSFGINSPTADQEYKSPFSLDNEGLQYIRVKAADFVGNNSGIHSNIYFCDLKAPNTTLTVGVPKFTSRDTLFISNKTSLKLSSLDDQCGVSVINYSIDNGTPEIFAKEIKINYPGYHTISYFATDKVNNKEIDGSQGVFVDIVPPVIHYHFSSESIGSKIVRDEPYTTYPSNVMLYIAATDASSGSDKIEYTINDGMVVTENPLKNLKPGNYLIEIKAYDVLGNESAEKVKFAIEK
jgi:hypothetical protein